VPVNQSSPDLEDVVSCDSTHTDPEALTGVRTRLLSPAVVQSVADVFRLLGDPTRVRLVDALSHGERCVCDLAGLLGLTESAVSHQLRLLRAARLVRARRAGRMAYYSLDDHHVVGLLHDTRKHVQEPEGRG
jgi:DNA-binding transcriptional ArsR family regulator